MGRPAAVVGALVAVLCSLPIVHATADEFRQVRNNPADRLLEHPIDDLAYDFAYKCNRFPRPGTRALEAWLDRHFGGISWGIMRCSKLNRRHHSLHAEGRALDWHLEARHPGDRATARRLIRMLLAPDRLGNPQALARRMGIQEIIWNCTTWWAGSTFLAKYHGCYGKSGRRLRHVGVTTAHRDHIHIGLNRRGAARKTTFWAMR
jgi:hypothetical protein